MANRQQDPAAEAFYGTLKRQNLFTIYHRLHSAKRPETQQKRMAELLAKLGRGDAFDIRRNDTAQEVRRILENATHHVR